MSAVLRSWLLKFTFKASDNGVTAERITLELSRREIHIKIGHRFVVF